MWVLGEIWHCLPVLSSWCQSWWPRLSNICPAPPIRVSVTNQGGRILGREGGDLPWTQVPGDPRATNPITPENHPGLQPVLYQPVEPISPDQSSSSSHWTAWPIILSSARPRIQQKVDHLLSNWNVSQQHFFQESCLFALIWRSWSTRSVISPWPWSCSGFP